MTEKKTEPVEQRSKARELKPEEVLLVRMLELELDPDIGILKPAEVVGLNGEFKSKDIFTGYTDRLDRQADVLESSCGTKRRSAVLKDVERASTDLDDAERATDTSPDIILKDVTVADLVRHQDLKRVFALGYLHPWPTTRNERTKRLMLELVTAVLELKLLTPFEFLKAIGFNLLASRRVPEETLHLLLETAVTMGEGGKNFKGSHFLGIFKPEIMVECFGLEDLDRVLLAVAEKYKWLPEEVETPPSDAEGEDRETRRPDGPTVGGAILALDNPGTPVESIAPPAAPAPTAQANEDDVEIVFDSDGGTGTHAVPPPSGEAAPLPSPLPRTVQEPTPDTVDVDAAFDALIQGDKKDEPAQTPVPLSGPGEGAMVIAASKDVADQWRGKTPAGGATPGSGSRSGSSLKRQT